MTSNQVFRVIVQRAGRDLPLSTHVAAESPMLACEAAERREAFYRNDEANLHLYFARWVRDCGAAAIVPGFTRIKG